MATISEAMAMAFDLHQAGRLNEAAAIYRQILAADPNDANAWHLLGLIAYQTGNRAKAIEQIGRAVRLNPSFAEAHFNLGNACFMHGKHEEAIAAYSRALSLGLNQAPVHYFLGLALYRVGKRDEAASAYRKAIELKPDYVEAHCDLGTTFKDAWKFDEAAACYRRALELKPDYAEALSNLGVVFHKQGKLDEAVAAYRQAVKLKPLAETYCSLGLTLQDQRQLEEAADCYRRAIELQPELVEAHFCQSTLQLLQGDFVRGWHGFEARWKTGRVAKRDFRQPPWNGEPLGQRTILLHAEQGFGDTIQFVRYARVVNERNPTATVVVECQKRLVKLLTRCRGIDRLVGEGNELPAFDVHAPLMSLPGLCGTTMNSIPAEAPYLFAEPALVEDWGERLRPLNGLKVGINWQGRTGQGEFRKRDVPLEQFEKLARVSGVRLISLQRGEGELRAPSSMLQVGDGVETVIVDLGELDTTHGGFMDTAAIMKNLDLVITSDTSVPHLAGALGVRVWLALPYAADWRWLLDRSDSPWYPTMRLFRQKRLGDWDDAFDEIKAELVRLVEGARRMDD